MMDSGVDGGVICDHEDYDAVMDGGVDFDG